MIRTAPLLPLTVLSMLVALSFWLSKVGSDATIQGKRELRTEPDLVIENFAARKLSASGDMEYSVNAGKMSHFGNDDSSVLENVEFVAVQPDKPRMTAKAPRGQLIRRDKAADEVVLDGGVSVVTEPHPNFPPIQLTTPKLTVIPDRNIAQSSDGVRLTSTAGSLDAKSFLLNTETRHVSFHAVEMSYAPRSKP